MQVLVQGAVHALGYLEEGKYYREPDCYETLRDLIRYLRLDTPEMTARIQCGRHNVISQDLIPILKCDDDEMDDDLFDVAIRLLVNLCQPAIASLQGKPPEDRDQWQLYWTLEENLMRAKSAFSDVAFFVVLKTRLEKYFIHTEWADRVEDGRILMERIILLIRYILAIQPSNRDTKNILANNCHDRVVIAFLASDIDEVLLHISTQSAEKEFHVAIVDIFALLLQEHTPEDLLVSNEDLVAKERKAAEKELQSVRERESVKDVQRKTALNPRHSRFGGAYTLKGMKSASSSNDMIVLKPVKNTTNVTFLDERKKKKRTPKNRRPFETNDNTHTSSEELREALHSLVLKIVERAFNRIMKSAKQMVFELRAAAHRNTQIHYFQLMKFVLRFSRLAKLPLALVSCCVGVEAFHDAQLRLDNYLESAAVLKGAEAKAVGIKAQYALAAFDELILLHQYAAEKGDEREQTHAREAISHILRVEEYRELSPMLFAKFSPGVLSKVFLRELITTTHNYLRLLEKFVKRGDLKNVCKKTKSKEVFDEKAMLDVMTSEQLDGLWTEVEAEMSTLLADFQMGDEVSPVNFALDVVDDRLQQQFAMLTIQRKVRAKELTTAVTMYRTSRRLWPEDGVFGKDEMSADDELGEFREIFFANLLEVAIEMRKEEAKVSIPADTEEKDAEGDVDADDDGLSEDEEEDDRFQVTEVAFDFDSFVAKYAKSDVLQWYIFALNDFQTNSVELNKAIVKMLHRIAFDLQMASRIYQLSLFNVLMKVNEFFACIPSDEQKGSAFFELHTFGFHLLKKFFTAYQSGKDKLGLEVLFWKSAKESYEIDHGYGTFEKEKEESTQTWPEELEEEVRNLYIEYRDMDECPQDIDVLDFIEHNLSRGRTRKQIFKKLKELGLDSLGAKSKKRV